jgi:hypothetical protein
MTAWLIIVIGSALAGAICALRLTGRIGLMFAAGVPVMGVLAWLLYLSDQPYGGGGASMWPIAVLFAGTVAATSGLVAYLGTRKLLGAVV